MIERYNLRKMLLEIQDDEAIDTEKATHLSQDQIKDLVKRRKAKSKEQTPNPDGAL